MSMSLNLQQARTVAAVIVSLVFSNATQAAEIEYSKVGWWQVSYREVDELTGCHATAEFQDQTKIAIAFIRGDNHEGWSVFISNPRWSSWVSKKREHVLWVAAINPNKLWHGVWSASDVSGQVYSSVRPEFINSLANAKTIGVFDESKRPLISAPLSMKDSEDALRAVMSCVRDHPLNSPRTPDVRNSPEVSTASSSGTGFFVAPNLLVTGNHVVKECGNTIEVRYPDRMWHTATIEGQDNTNDLALLRTDMENLSVASFRLQSRVGEPVATYGFPYAGLLSSSGNFTIGNVAALTGINDDSRFIQTSAPVQPGNSGGPLLDLSGSVIGVIASRLNAIKMMQQGGSIPQDVNFAIQAPIVVNFLSTKGVNPKSDSAVGHAELPPADVAEIAKKFTVQIYCLAGSSGAKVSQSAPTRPITGIEQQAKEFVLWLQSKWSKPNAEALAGLETLYDDDVMYFGKFVKREVVIREKQAFARKFPEREYRPREPISISCSDRVCTVSGIVDYRAVDPIGKILSEGVASFEYRLVVTGAALKISLENGSVLSRNRTSLSSVSSYERDGAPVSPVSERQDNRRAKWHPAR
jgi:S1-C subfamily serine protease